MEKMDERNRESRKNMLDRIMKGLLMIALPFGAIAGIGFCYIGIRIIYISVSVTMVLKVFIGAIIIVVGALIAVACSIFLLQTIKEQ